MNLEAAAKPSFASLRQGWLDLAQVVAFTQIAALTSGSDAAVERWRWRGCMHTSTAACDSLIPVVTAIHVCVDIT